MVGKNRQVPTWLCSGHGIDPTQVEIRLRFHRASTGKLSLLFPVGIKRLSVFYRPFDCGISFVPVGFYSGLPVLSSVVASCSSQIQGEEWMVD